MKTFYPNILSFVTAWAFRVLLVMVGMAIAVRIMAQNDCGVTIENSFDNPVLDCNDPIPSFAPFTAMSNCCTGPIEMTYFESSGSEFVENCNVTTAFGPGPDWAIWLPNLPGGLSQYWNFVGNAQWQAFNDGTAHLQGLIAMQGNSANQFELDIWFHQGVNWTQWNALGRQYKDDLNMAGTEYLNWMYYEMAPQFATLTGMGNLTGSHLQLSHQPSSYYYGFQSGLGANNRNGNQGISGWFYYSGTVNGQSANGHGDVNLDSSCESGEGCANTIQTLVVRAEDTCGHIAYASQSITVLDTTAPMVDPFEPIISMDCEDYQGIYITATDNCSQVSITYVDQSEGQCAPVTRTYTIADACGNTTTAIQTIILSAGERPVFTVFPGPLTIDCKDLELLPTPEVLWEVGCGGEELIITQAQIDGSCPNSFEIHYTYIVTDNCGGSDTAVWVVSVEDLIAPELFNVPLDIEINCGDEIPDANVFAIDNCDPNVLTSLSATTEYNECGYNFIRTWTSTDVCGNTATATQTIYVNDIVKPVFTFVPASVMLPCGTPFELAIPTAEDACSFVEMEWADVDLEDCAGSYARIFRAFDGCGNSRLATVFVMFTDLEAPEMTEFPDDVFVSCDMIPSTQNVDVAYVDNCGNVSVEVDETIVNGDCPGAYTLVRTWTLTDDCGNSSAHDWNIHVTDTEAPQILGVPANMIIACGDEIMDVAVVADDNCVDFSEITLSAVTIQNECGYTFNRTWTAVDGCGNTSQASQSITVEDNVAPYFTYVPLDINLACSTGEVIADEMATAEDECSEVTVTFFDTVFEGNCGNGILRTFVATDGCGNVEIAEQVISSSDVFAPEFTFVSAEIMADCGDIVEIPAPIATDECSEVVVTFEDVQLTTCGGSFVRNYTATDGCGNTAIASVNVVYNDDQNPAITSGPQDIEVECDAVPSIESAELEFNDNCGNIEIAQNEVRIDGDCPNAYTLVRTYTISDDCGNSADWVWTIEVIDNTSPDIIGVPPSETINCGDEIPAAEVIAVDNCDTEPTLDLSAETINNECGYQFIRTWTATDQCGNSSEQSQIILVTDNVEPNFTFVPSDVNFSCGDFQEIEMATADDECSEVSVTFEDEIIDPLTGSFIRHWLAADGCGNIAEEETAVTFNPDGPPAVLCPANQSVIADNNCSASIPDYTQLVWVEADCIDLNTLIITQNPIAGSLITENTLLTITVTNESNESASCSFTVELIDQTGPIVVCPDNQILNLDDNCSAVIPDYSSLLDAEDACNGNVSITQTPASGSVVFGTNTIPIVFVVSDDSGNASECTFNVQPEDHIAPVFTIFPANTSVQCDQIPGAEMVNIQYTDNCSGVTMSMNESVAVDDTNCQSTYAILRTYTITDESGNSTSQVWTIQVEDNTMPQLFGVPSDIILQCGDPIPDAQVFATDNCDDDVNVSIEANTISSACGYIFQRTWIAIDDCGNVSEAIQNITIEDNVDPFFTFVPATTTIACDDYALIFPTLASAIAGDECSEVEVTFVDDVSDDCSGSFVRIWTATDGCGNTVSAETSYIVEDLDAPEFTVVPGNITISGCNNLPEASIDQIAYTENCSNVTLTTADDVTIMDCPNNQIIYRVWRLTDECGNQSSYTQEIYVIDETGPEIFGVPANEVLSCGQAPSESSITATDNCSASENINISLHAKTTQLSCGNIFVRVWTATDECGNSTTATQEITYIDDDAPIFTYVPQDYIGECGQEVVLEEPVVFDACSLVSYETTTDEPTCSGSYTRTFVATDGCGNTATADQLIIIEDLVAPIASEYQSLVTATCDDIPYIDESFVSFTDNCSELALTWNSDTTYLCGGSFQVLFTWTATDACGNQSEAFVALEVEDLDGPGFDVLPVDLTLSCGDIEPLPVISASDGCGSAYIEFNDNIIDLECGYQIERTWYAFDDCENIVSHIQYINYVDVTAPEFVAVPLDLTLECTDIIPAPTMVLGMDDCQGLVAGEMTSEVIVPGACNSNYQLLRTYTVTDECGHSASHLQTITIQDSEAPQFFDFDGTIEVNCQQSNGVFATAFDDCSSIGVSYSDDLVGSGCSGLIERTYTATDACGNSQSAIQMITLLDETDPYFTNFPVDVNADCSSIPSSETALLGYGDNCSNPSIAMVETEVQGSCANEFLILRDYTLTDACGNHTTQTWTITVQDLTPPEILGIPAESVIECGIGVVPAINPVAFDVCDAFPTLSFTAVTIPTETGCGEMFVRTWVATDACGHESTASHTTYILDTTAPVLSSTPGNQFVPCSQPLPPAPIITALDACDGELEVTFEESSLIGSCLNVSRIWCATDCAGNQTCHEQIIFRTTSPNGGAEPQLAAVNSSRHLINIQLLASDEGRWNLDVYDLTGRKITNLLTQDMKAGQQHQFDLDCNGFTDTIYLFRWSNGTKEVTQKVVMMK